MTDSNFSLTHRTRPSNLEKEAPLLLMLHGYGSDENDLFSFAGELPDKYFVVSARAPKAMQPFGNAWYEIDFEADGGKFSNIEQAVESRKLLTDFIGELEKHYPIKTSEHTLFGFSQGSILSYAVGLSQPEKFKQIVAMSGYIDEKMYAPDYRKNDFSNLRVFASHGTQDPVIPIEWARKNQPFLNELGIENIYEEFPIGHGINPQGFQELLKWLD